jgi:predicted transcriptional regulator
MSGAELLLVSKADTNIPFHDYLANYIKADKEFMDAVRRGLADCKKGRLEPWAQVKKELRID